MQQLFGEIQIYGCKMVLLFSGKVKQHFLPPFCFSKLIDIVDFKEIVLMSTLNSL